VLLGQHLGRREQGRLELVGDADEHRVERDDRLAAADVALEQAVHRLAALEVREDLPEGRLLRLREREREPAADALVEQAVDAHDRGRHPPVAHALGQAEPDLHEHQLVVDDPPAGADGLGFARGAVDGAVGVGPGEQLAPGEQVAREPFAHLGDGGVEVVGDHALDRVRRQPHRGGVDRAVLRLADPLDRVVDEVPLGVRHLRQVAEVLHPPLHAHLDAGVDLPAEVRTVEEHERQLARAVVDRRLEPRPAAAHDVVARDDLAAHGLHLLRDELPDRQLGRFELVVAREVFEQRAERVEPERLERLGARRADAVERLDRAGEGGGGRTED
jgi:hypothetical protein